MRVDNKRNILITGSGGLLGSELIKKLSEDEQFYIIAMTSQVNTLKKMYLGSNIKIISNDTWKEELNSSGVKIDTLINCAFPRSSDPKELASGIPFTESLIKDCINIDVKNIINISSQSVYTQKQKTDVTEQSPVQPESLYGMTKYACERIVSLLCEQHQIRYSNIRLGSLTGIDFDVRMTNRFVKNVLSGEKIEITGGKQKISYLDVRDAASGLSKMLVVNPDQWKSTYNFGNDEYFTLIDLVKIVKEKAKAYEIHNVDVKIKEGDSNYNNVMNNNLFYRQFSFQPKFHLDKMIEELFSK